MRTEHAGTHSGYLRTLPYEPAYPHSAQIRTRVVYDNGNRWLKWLSPTNEVKTILSCIKEVSEAQWKRLKPDADTVLIETDGKRYAIGKQAQALGGDPTYQKNKCELAEILALVAIEPNPGLDRVHISKFAIALPNSLNDADMAALKRLENYPLTKEFRR